ncbi:hypothetical protein DCE93_09735 [Agromyces badenianii]|uniref:UDP-N-acetylglucosamine 2-epimerase domain-containing protein n=1 Tax=Agromyces badenianii TaxID=2080742 RepID=A0A2S0WX80_9MICO|nr:UDP-N-acetylglucosamine 2-epimerase [Agromyces badenianii]AWB95908.1 hypothetical protein DCE93_09735 [Agromyces badenianii]
MIIFIYGTTAEAIKIAPVARRLGERGVPYQQWITQQHTESLRKVIPQLGLPEPDRVIANGNKGEPLTSPLQMVGWVMTVFRWGLANIRGIRKTLPKGSAVIVHGDTVTTVLGTLIGRRLRVPVAHVEAGLRSGNWRHPFPEELDRRIVGRLADIHYVPSAEAAHNLAGRKNVVNTHGNTAKDAVLDTRTGEQQTEVPYGLVLLHRFEFISNRALVRETLETLDAHSPVELRVIVDSYSQDAVVQTIEELGLERFVVMPKLEHGRFVAALRSATFIVTDSGGIQQESAVVGTPTLVHRKTTESAEGIGTNVVLSGWDFGVLREFLSDYESHRVVDPDAGASPSDIIVDDLFARGIAVSRVG